jgi:catechol 2,3-dioxygenase-like lactoylglutathione lyase family enzyme
VAFYRHLGLTELPRDGAPERDGAWLGFADGRELHLSVGPPKAPTRAHFAVLVDDLTAARTVFEKLNAPIETGRALPGIARFFVRDPDGNRIEIAQRIPGS